MLDVIATIFLVLLMAMTLGLFIPLLLLIYEEIGIDIVKIFRRINTKEKQK